MSAPRLSASELAVVEALRGLRFGSVEAVIHDGRLVRLERREKLRLEGDPDAGAASSDNEHQSRKRPDRRSDLDILSRGES
jgi:hypothetical protein